MHHCCEILTNKNFVWNLNYFQKSQITNTDIWRFEIRNFKTQKWVSMFLSYLVEKIFLVILRPRIFFWFWDFFQKKTLWRCEKWSLPRELKNGIKNKISWLESVGFFPGVSFFVTLSDVPASRNLPVKYSFRYRKWYFNVSKDAQLLLF
jgi:hypothetical protein